MKSYNIRKLYYPALLGGVLPIMVLGTRNANWLKVDKKWIKILIAFGISIYLAEMIVFAFLSKTESSVTGQVIIGFFRSIPLLLYLGYYLVLRPKYKDFLETRNVTVPMVRDAFIFSIIGLVIEFLLVLVGGMYISKFLPKTF